MNIKNAFFYTIKPEDLKVIWTNFSNQINGEFKFRESIRANVDGPIYVYSIIANYENFKLKIDQTVYINPGHNDQPTPLSYSLTKQESKKIYFRIWEKGFIENLLGLNKLNSGISEIDKNYSLQTNIKNLRDLIIKDEVLREKITSSNYILLIETRKKTLEIILKRPGISETIDDFSEDFKLLDLVLKEIPAHNKI